MIHEGLVTTPYHLSDRLNTVRGLMKKYRNIPMSFADACLVSMAEMIPASTILTLDSDFLVYRMREREVIPVIAP